MTKVAAIMQPTFLPWLGYLNMLDQADVFILLDNVGLNTKSWQTRNRIRSRDGRTIWLTIPTHGHRGDRLDQVPIVNEHGWQRKHQRSIETAYSHAPYWGPARRPARARSGAKGGRDVLQQHEVATPSPPNWACYRIPRISSNASAASSPAAAPRCRASASSA